VLSIFVGLMVLVSLMFGLLYAPNARQGALRWITPGGLFAVILWMPASVLFEPYLRPREDRCIDDGKPAESGLADRGKR
jgi:uncharacterized BrkB/YihY/UPF0761 family membrane protein